jgi:hypothetical protein
MKTKVMIKITDIQKQVIDGKYSYLKPIFKKINDATLGYKVDHNMTITDSDFEEFKELLELENIYVTWEAIGKFYGVKF